MEVLASGESSQKKGRKKEPGRSGKKSTSGKTSTTAFSLPGPCCSSSLPFARGPRPLSLFLLFLLFALSSPPFSPSLPTFFLSPPPPVALSHICSSLFLFLLRLPPRSFFFLFVSFSSSSSSPFHQTRKGRPSSLLWPRCKHTSTAASSSCPRRSRPCATPVARSEEETRRLLQSGARSLARSGRARSPRTGRTTRRGPSSAPWPSRSCATRRGRTFWSPTWSNP